MAHTILLVDDSPTHRSLIKVFLSGQDFNFVEGSSGKQALDLLRTEHVDLIIADINMPEMDGLQFVGELRTHPLPSLRKTPVVLLTGDDSQRSTHRRAEAAGADAFLRKPISSAGLLDVVTQLLGRSSS